MPEEVNPELTPEEVGLPNEEVKIEDEAAIPETEETVA